MPWSQPGFKSRPTHFCGEHHHEHRERQRACAHNYVSREIVMRDLNPTSRAQRPEGASTSGSGSNPGRRVARPNGVRSRRRERGAKRPVNALPSVVRRPTSRSLCSQESRPTHFCGEHHREHRERRRACAHDYVSHECIIRDLNPTSRAQRPEGASTSGSGSNPGRRTPFGRASPDFSLAPLARIPADAFLWRTSPRAAPHTCSALLAHAGATKSSRGI